MAYISTEEVRAIRNELKATFPEYRFSVKKRHHSSVDVDVIKGPAFEDYEFFDRYKCETRKETLNGVCENINHYHLDWYGEKNKSFFEKVVEVIKTAPAKVEGGRAWFDESDIMTDYFHTAFYISIGVGKNYENGYVVTA